MWFIDREEELKRLKRGVLQGENFVLIAPRRYGKTTLIKKVIQELKEQTINFYIDLMPYADSPQSLANYLLEVFLKDLGITEGIKRFTKSLSLKAKLLFEELGIEIELSRGEKDPLIELGKILEIPQKIAKKKDKRVLVAYDEFGELHMGAGASLKVFRSVIQHHTEVSYIFAGSQETLMEKIFIDKKGAFFRFGTIIELSYLNLEEVLRFAQKHISLQPTPISLIETLKGHPYYTSRFLQKLKMGLKPINAFEELIMEERSYVELLVEKAKTVKGAIEVLQAIAMGKNPYNSVGTKPQMVNKILQRLRFMGLIRKLGRSLYEITDPLLEGYLSGELEF